MIEQYKAAIINEHDTNACKIGIEAESTLEKGGIIIHCYAHQNRSTFLIGHVRREWYYQVSTSHFQNGSSRNLQLIQEEINDDG